MDFEVKGCSYVTTRESRREGALYQGHELRPLVRDGRVVDGGMSTVVVVYRPTASTWTLPNDFGSRMVRTVVWPDEGGRLKVPCSVTYLLSTVQVRSLVKVETDIRGVSLDVTLLRFWMNHGMFLTFESKGSYCHLQCPRQTRRTHGWTVGLNELYKKNYIFSIY